MTPSIGTLRAAAAACLVLAAASAPAQTAYVSSEKDDALTLIDAKTLTVKGTLPTCKRGRHIQLMPDGKVMVACTDSNAADIIDPATGKSVRRVPLGDEPEAFDVSPDGRMFFVSNEDEGAASFVDAATGKVLKNVKVGKEPERIALTPDGKELWVTNELDASVSIVSLATLEVTATIKFEMKGARAEDITPVGITMSRDGKRAFVALGRANHVAFVDVAARKVTDLVLVGKRAWNVTLDKAGKQLWVVNGLSDDVTVIDVAGAKAIKSIPVGRVPYGVVIVE